MERAERIIRSASGCSSKRLLVPVLWLMLVLTLSPPCSGSCGCGRRPRLPGPRRHAHTLASCPVARVSRTAVASRRERWAAAREARRRAGDRPHRHRRSSSARPWPSPAGAGGGHHRSGGRPRCGAVLRRTSAQVERNLRRVQRAAELPRAHAPAAVNATFESYRAVLGRVAAIAGNESSRARCRHVVSRLEPVETGLAAGKGVILALPHLGGWEWAGSGWRRCSAGLVTVVVEALEPPELFEWFADLRRSFGMNIVPLGTDAASQVLQALRENHVVCLLCDREHRRGRRAGRLLRGVHHPAVRAGDHEPPHRRPRAAHRRVLHRSRRRAPRCRAPAAADDPDGEDPSRRGRHHPGAGAPAKCSSGGRPSSGTCSSPTGHPTPDMASDLHVSRVMKCGRGTSRGPPGENVS